MSNSGIYVQVPFCQTKCTYCNFHTGVVASSRFRPYVEAVCREIRGHRLLLEAVGENWPGRLRRGGVARETGSEGLAVDTVYIGGGGLGVFWLRCKMIIFVDFLAEYARVSSGGGMVEGW